MSIYASAFRQILFPLYDGMLRGRETAAAMRSYESNLELSLDELQALQVKKLRALLQHAYDHVAYYRRAWDAEGVRPDDVREVSDLASFPLLTREDVRNNFNDLRADNAEHNIVKATGGSSGEPLKFEISRRSNELREAVMWRGYGWGGLRMGARTAYLWGVNAQPTTLGARLRECGYHRLYNRRIFDSFSLAEHNLEQYVDALNRYRAEAMVCYVAPAVTMAQYIIDTGKRVHSPQVILTGAEPLLEFQRELIAAAFQCKVINTYGSREFMLIASECDRQRGLHVNIDHLVVETLDEQGGPVQGESGRVVVTDLSNLGMPFIRYVNGDMATLTTRCCNCGNPLPLMERVDGRRLDVIHAPNGARLPGEFFPHLLKDYGEITRFQVRQDRPDHIELRVVAPGGVSDETRQAITDALNGYTAGTLELQVLQVDSIPLTSAGKHRVVVNELDGGRQ